MTAPVAPAPQPAVTGELPRVRPSHTGRNAELALLALAMVIVAGYAATVEANVLGTVTPDFWVPTAALSIVFIANCFNSPIHQLTNSPISFCQHLASFRTLLPGHPQSPL